MNTNFEDLVTESLEQRATAVWIPANLAGLVDRARRQRRRRQYLVRSGLTAATAAGLAVAVPLATATTPQREAPLHAQTVAYIVGHAERSITTGAARQVEVGRVTWHQGHFVGRIDGRRFALGTTLTWTYGGATRAAFYSASGRLLFDEGSVNPTAAPGEKRAGRIVGADYVARTWWHLVIASANEFGIPDPPASCKAGPVAGIELTPVVLPFETLSRGWLSYDLRCGYFRQAGRQRVDGVNAIKIVSTLGRSGRMTIWVSPATYLPVRSVNFVTPISHTYFQIDYRWLPASSRNLALLNPRIPAGFRRVAQNSQLWYRVLAGQ